MKQWALFRIVAIVKMATVFFIQLTLFERRHRDKWDSEATRKWEALVRKQAAEYRRTALRLEGLLIKLGQFLSTRADVMPKAFIEELEGLIDRVPAVPWEEAKAVMEKEWGRPVSDVLARIDETPVASASIGQVYRAWLPDGTDVAVKVQRPNIERIITVDFKAIRIVLFLADRLTSFGKKTDLPALYREMRAIIGAELDFQRELQNGTYFRSRYEPFADVDIPAYNETLSKKRVLVMDWVEGARITDLAFLEKNGLDRHRIAVRLTEIFLEQLLQEGKFHADPHPGNLLVKADGTIVLIDFGMIGELPASDAVFIRAILQGILTGDDDAVVSGLEGLQFLLPHADKERLKRAIRAVVDAYSSRSFANLEDNVIQDLLEDIQQIVKEEPVQMPAGFAFLGRAVSTFIGVLHILDPDIDLIDVGRRPVLDWLRRNSRTSPQDTVWQFIRPLVTLPQKLSAALDEPARQREWETLQNRRAEQERFLLSSRREALLYMMASITGAAAVFYYTGETWVEVSASAIVLAALWNRVRTVRAHRAFLKE